MQGTVSLIAILKGVAIHLWAISFLPPLQRLKMAGRGM
jgi:hypothetical protein